MGTHPLIGDWRLVSWRGVVDGRPHDLFGPHPKGFLLLTPEGRAMALTTAEGRGPGGGEAERAALHRSMLAYTGRYRIEGDEFITAVDASWNEVWNGTEQRRRYRVEGDRLFVESAPGPSILFPGRTDHRVIVWERERPPDR